MEYYQDITLLPDAEANLGFLWQKVFQQVHLALVENKIAPDQSAIALSMPKYGDSNFPLGNQIRLLGSQQGLEALQVNWWLRKLLDYVHIKPIRPVPADVTQYACFKRKHRLGEAGTEKKLERKARYLAEKFGEDYEKLLKTLLKDQVAGHKDKLPFIRVVRNKAEDPEANSFPLFISMDILDQPKVGTFNCYGLSSLISGKLATVPLF
jgi:CRISPR-associated endonuclease Csy4